MPGPFFEAYLPLGDLLIKFIHSQTPKKRSYKRSLDLNQAIAETTYNIGSSRIERHYFISHPNKVLVIHIESKGTERLNIELKLSTELKLLSISPEGEENRVDQDSEEGSKMQGIMLRGKCPKHLDVYNRNKVPDWLIYDTEEWGPGINFTIQAKVKTEDGIVSFSEDKLVVMGASVLTIYVAASTDYADIDKALINRLLSIIL